MIKKEDLVHGKYYGGRCRNALLARWDKNKNRFIYRRYKFGNTFLEEICHPEDDMVWDVFIPECEMENNITEKEIPLL